MNTLLSLLWIPVSVPEAQGGVGVRPGDLALVPHHGTCHFSCSPPRGALSFPLSGIQWSPHPLWPSREGTPEGALQNSECLFSPGRGVGLWVETRLASSPRVSCSACLCLSFLTCKIRDIESASPACGPHERGRSSGLGVSHPQPPGQPPTSIHSDFACLTSFRAELVLLVWGPSLENHGPSACERLRRTQDLVRLSEGHSSAHAAAEMSTVTTFLFQLEFLAMQTWEFDSNPLVQCFASPRPPRPS